MASSIRIHGGKTLGTSPEAKGPTPAPQALLTRLSQLPAGAARDEVAAQLEKLLPAQKKQLDDALQTFDSKQREKLIAACTTGKTPQLAALFKSTVRAVDDAEFRRRVGSRKELIAAHESGKALAKSMDRLDIIADKAVAAFDPLTGDVLVDVDRLAGKDVDAVLEHELAHRKLHQLTPDQRSAIVKAFTSSPLWPKLRDGVEASDPAVVNMTPSRLVDELLAIVTGEPKHPLAALARPILQSKALEPLRNVKTTNNAYVDTSHELELDAWVETDGPDASANWSRLNDTQKHALRDAETNAIKNSSAQHTALLQRVQRLGFSAADLDQALQYLSTKAQITVNFQPDKMTGAGAPLIDRLTAEDEYRNQFETKISGGSLAPTEGSMRDGWERTIFRGDYHTHSLIPAERPKYGSLNAEENARGGATHYGNSFLVLKDGVKNRLTLTPYDSSVMNADLVGTMSHLENVLVNSYLPDGKLTEIMNKALGRSGAAGDFSSNYIEVQVHGPIDLKTDTARVVANAMYKGNATYEPKLREFAKKLGVELEWTNGTIIYDDNSVPVNFSFAGIGNVMAPAAPKDFTAVHYGDSVAYVPAVAGAALPDALPRGFVAVTHPAFGKVAVPERFAPGGKLSEDVLFGEPAAGLAAPIAPAGKAYQVPNPTGYGALFLDGPQVPAGYTAVSLSLAGGAGFAFVPVATDTPAPETPFGFAAVKHPKAGSILVPKKFAAGDALAPGVVFGTQLAGLAAPVVSLAPPPPVNYSLTHIYGPAYGATNVVAPPAPPDYTAVRYGDTVAFVPSKAGAAVPEEAPAGYVPFKHPTAGLTFVPAKYMIGGTRAKDTGFGVVANGLAAPAVTLAQLYSFSAGYPTEAPVPPPGYTVLRVGASNTVAFAPAVKDAPVPAEAPDGYAAVKDPEAGTVFVPLALASGDKLAEGNVYGETAKDMPAPLVALAPPPPVTVSLPHPSGPAYGRYNLAVPPAPEGFTIVGYQNSVAYVPAKADAPLPKKPPNGFTAVAHPEAGTVFIPTALVSGGELNPAIPFGGTATGYAEPVVAVAPPPPITVNLQHPSGAAYGRYNITVPPAPDGFTIVGYSNNVAYVKTRADAPDPKKPPFGYVAVKHPEAGTVYILAGMVSGTELNPSIPFGPTAASMPEPFVAVAPPPPVTVQIPNPAGPAYGASNYSVPPAPDGYTIVGYANNVAYVPTKAGVAEPKKPPFGYVPVTDPDAGLIYVPAGLVVTTPAGPELNPAYAFGKVASGYAAPVVDLSPPPNINVTVENPAGPAYGKISANVPPAPDGYTIVGYSNTVAYVPKTEGVGEVKRPPVGYVAAKHPGIGTVYVPAGYAPGGVLNPGYAFGKAADGFAAPAVSIAVPPPQVFQFGGVNINAYPPPPGFTVALYAGNQAAYVRASTDAKLSYIPPNYVVVNDPTLGEIMLPQNFAPGGARYAGYFFTTVATGQPAAFMDINGK
jgi:hypothetical protein